MSDYKTAKRRFWENHIGKWELSGLSQVEYCRENDIKVKSFRYWKRRVGRLGGAPALVEVPFPQPSTPSPCAVSSQLCLVIDQKYRIEIGKGFDPEDLERLLRVVAHI
jgi:hypothetical protein